MKLEMIKQAGGSLVPADDYTAEKMKRFKVICIVLVLKVQ